jgi:hypothetical protein
MSGRNNPTIDVVVRIVDKFPEIDTNWLITGAGEMLLSTDETPSFSSEQTKEEDSPVYNKPNESKKPATTSNVDIFASTISSSKSSSRNKQIDRIIVIYTDDSFKEYRPE